MLKAECILLQQLPNSVQDVINKVAHTHDKDQSPSPVNTVAENTVARNTVAGNTVVDTPHQTTTSLSLRCYRA